MSHSHRPLHRSLLVASALTAVALLTGCQPAASNETPQDQAAQTAPAKGGKGSSAGPKAAAGTALEALASLPVKGRASMTGYDRDQFGTEWSDAAGDFDWARNGCDTRNDVLARDLQREVVESNGCVVISGVLAFEPYTGETNRLFDKHDNDYSTDFDVEHIVALGNAWVTGAQQLSADQRSEIANDPINLMLTDPSLNRAKSDADFATWLPPNKAFRCSYAARQIRVKAKYGLWVTAPEKAAMESVLATCPNEPLDQPEVQAGYTADEPTTTPSDPEESTSAPEETETAESSSPSTTSGSAHYANCTEAREAGAAPVRKGDPGYGPHLDRDGDGSACE